MPTIKDVLLGLPKNYPLEQARHLAPDGLVLVAKERGVTLEQLLPEIIEAALYVGIRLGLPYTSYERAARADELPPRNETDAKAGKLIAEAAKRHLGWVK